MDVHMLSLVPSTTFLEQPSYFTKPPFLWVKYESPPLFSWVRGCGGGGRGKILKIQTLLYKGGEFQLWTRLLISFSQDF